MFENIETIKKQLEEYRARMESPEVYSDVVQFSALEKECRAIEPLVDSYESFRAAEAEMESAMSLMDDEEMHELAKEEYRAALAKRNELEHKIRFLLLPKDPNDEKNIIFEIRAGVGGEESALFAGDLYRMYSMFAEKKGWKTEIINISETGLGGIKEIVFLIEGDRAFSKLKYESGGHRVQRVPVTESGGRIHTSAATVAVLPEVDEIDFKLDLNEVRIDVFRSSGAGGQKVNKTSSAIRATHIPTGIVVECQDERSQYKNKDRALQILRSKLYEIEQSKKDAAVAAERRLQVGTGDRSDRIRTYNFPQNRVTDHRLTGEIKNFNLEKVINGDLDDIIDALTSQFQAERLKNENFII